MCFFVKVARCSTSGRCFLKLFRVVCTARKLFSPTLSSLSLGQGQSSEYQTEIRFDTKNVRRWRIPFNRIDSLSCVLWHVPHNVHHPTGDKLRVTCQPCRVLHCDMVEKPQMATMEQKLAQTSVSQTIHLNICHHLAKKHGYPKCRKSGRNWQPNCHQL